MSDVGQFISNVGFPIAVACGAGLILYKVFMGLFQRVLDTCEQLTTTNEKLVDTNRTFIDHFNSMKEDIKDVKIIVQDIKKEVIK